MELSIEEVRRSVQILQKKGTHNMRKNNEAKVLDWRKALCLISRIAVEMTRGTVTGEAPTRKEVDDWAMRICDILDAASSAPVRNCDLLADADEAKKVLHGQYSLHIRPHAERDAAIEWLFAKAKGE